MCFRALNGTSLEHSKHTAAGVAERLAVLRNVDEYTRGDWRTVARELGSEGHRVGLDDVLDAFVLALTAWAPKEELHRLLSGLFMMGKGYRCKWSTGVRANSVLSSCRVNAVSQLSILGDWASPISVSSTVATMFRIICATVLVRLVVDTSFASGLYLMMP